MDCTTNLNARYDSDRPCAELKRRRAKACIKPMPHRNKASRPRRAIYALRNRVERFFNRLKYVHAIASRFEETAANDLAPVKLASAGLWMRFMSR
jgi:transposase